MAGADVRYDMGEPDPGAATGWFARNLDLTVEGAIPRRLAELHHDARPLLVDLSGGLELAEAMSPWSDRVDRVAAHAKTPVTPALLVRPDGYIAWSGADPDSLRAALGRWFGSPA